MPSSKHLQVSELETKTTDQLTKMVHDFKNEVQNDDLQVYIQSIQKVLGKKLLEKLKVHEKKHDHGDDKEK